MRRWDRSADGERIVGRALDRAVATGDLVALHDRRMPGRGGNIDHVFIGPRRILVVDAKLAFVGADLGYLGVGRSRDVWFMAPDDVVRAATKRIIGKWPYSVDIDRRREIAGELARAFPAA